MKTQMQSLFSSLPKSVEWAGLRFVNETTSYRVVRNDKPESNQTNFDQGAMIEVYMNGHFGYGATADLSSDGLQRALSQAIATTEEASKYKVFPFTKAQRPSVNGRYQSALEKRIDSVGLAEITDCLIEGSKAMKGSELIVNRMAYAMLIQTQIDFYSTSGAETRQNFEMSSLHLGATAAKGSEAQSRSWGPTGQFGGEVFQKSRFQKEGARVAREALELLAAENCPEEAMDLLLSPDQMMLQIHESIGHPLELDRILGDERNYAGWSFVKPEDFGKLQYGSKLMNVSFDPTVAHEFASYAFDDVGNEAKKEYLIEGGKLLRGLGSLESQARSGLKGVANSRSSSWNRAPIDRMANINLEPGTSSLQEMISKTQRGIFMHTNRSWSIDDYRNKFQFGCEYAQLIEEGKLTKVVKNPNYRGVTVDFWNRLKAVGTKDLMEIHGTPYCGKGEPNQVIRVGHAAPPCLFEKVEVFGGGK
jgi:predicted Zn-dependent protease